VHVTVGYFVVIVMLFLYLTNKNKLYV